MAMPSTKDFGPAGYARLVARHRLKTVPNWHESIVTGTATRKEAAGADGSVVETYGPTYWPGESDFDHLEFALKYDGTNLAMLSAIFKVLPAEGFAAFVAAAPFGKYRRRLWYLYEWLTGNRLPLPDMTSGNYVELAPEDECFTARRRRVARQRIDDNLLGDRSFCPVIRRTAALGAFAAGNLAPRLQALVAGCTPEILRRALSYLSINETRSSFAIEREEPSADRTERFVALLGRAARETWCRKPQLVTLQNAIVDPRFVEADYRTRQNWVGESVTLGQERVHYVCPRPGDVPALMEGLIKADERLRTSATHPVVHAALVGYGFVFIHPFLDGNGRIHRFLIHNTLATRGFTPPEIIVPVSAAMQRDERAYNASLEAFSRPLLEFVTYAFDAEGEMTVAGDWSDCYRFPDLTVQTEALFRFVEQTIDRDLPEELAFLRGYDRTKRLMQDVVDLPARQLDLFIRLCRQNGGSLSAAKRRSQFAMLRDDEITRLEEAVRQGFEPEEAEKKVPATKSG
jgi:hypothetical protein